MLRIAFALAVFLAMLSTDRYFSLGFDEVAILDTASAPLASTLHLFLAGTGQHKHPPLSDVLLHFWLPVAGPHPTLIRAPFMLCYVAALLVLARIAEKLGGSSAFTTTILVGAVWPFGFQFGRMAGWFSFSFLTVALLTYAYVRFLDSPCWARWWPVVVAAYLAVLSNYLCWGIAALLALDLLFFRSVAARWKYLGAGLAILVLGYGPIWRPFVSLLLDRSPEFGAVPHPVLLKLSIAGFCLYTEFISESIAPWFFQFSVVGGAAILLALVCMFRLSTPIGRRMAFGFFLLLAVLASIGLLTVNRLLFISGWLLIPIGCALARSARERVCLAAALAVVAVLGWAGIVSRTYYASPHFTEPWESLAETEAPKVAQGSVVASNNPPFLFYLGCDLSKRGISPTQPPCHPALPQVIDLREKALPASDTFHSAVLVRGVNDDPDTQAHTEATEIWLSSRCRLESKRSMLEDHAAALKERMFGHHSDRYRITVEDFLCP